MKIGCATGLFILGLFTISCAHKPAFTVPQQFETAKRHPKLREGLRTIFPEQCRFSSRVTVNIAGKEMDFITYTALSSANARSKALGEIGTTLFDFLYVNGQIVLLAFPGQIPENIAKNGPGNDLYHLFIISREKTSGTSCGDYCVLIKSAENNYHIFEFSQQGVLISSKEYLNQNLLRECRYSEWKNFKSWHKKVPGHLVLINHDLGYNFDVDIIDVRPGLKNTKAFKIPENTQ
jgi:hypothetical protein